MLGATQRSFSLLVRSLRPGSSLLSMSYPTLLSPRGNTTDLCVCGAWTLFLFISIKLSDLYFLLLYPLCMFLKSEFTLSRITLSQKMILSLMSQFCKRNCVPSFAFDSGLHSATFKKSFPDGITGNHYFFSAALMHNIFPLIENIYCTEFEVSSE